MLEILKERYEKNMHRHPDIAWDEVVKLLSDDFLTVIKKMEETGGEPDMVVLLDGTWAYVDMSKESPDKRRSITYDVMGENERKKKNIFPKGNAIEMAQKMGVSVIDEDTYIYLQTVEDFDLKTSSWIFTPKDYRDKGGALFGEKRYDRAFIYTNGAQSFYSARGFRGMVVIKDDNN